MAGTIKEKVEQAGHKIAETAKTVGGEAGHKIAETAKTVGKKVGEGVEKVTAWVKEKTGQGACGTSACGTHIREHMDVIASCGKKVGQVDGVEAGSIKLTKNAPNAGGMHHYIPLDWVERVDEQVHLSKNSMETEMEWQAAPVRAGGG